MYSHEPPSRTRLLVLGGGIHGVGVLHDVATRGWQDIHLIEKGTLGVGTSSRSTKLIHGGLRYLKQVRDFGLVTEALRERQNLIDLAPDLVHPVQMLFPILKKGGMPRLMVKAGLTMYDTLAGRYRIRSHEALSEDEVLRLAPVLAKELFTHYYSFWDAQTDDLGLVKRIAASAVKLGANITEGCRAKRLWQTEDGWNVEVVTPEGKTQIISALYVVNATGPWANRLLESGGVEPTHRAINNKGIHLLFDDMGLKASLFLQSPDDNRIFFILPWEGCTLVGTTEDLYTEDPDKVCVNDQDVHYLLERCNRYLKNPLQESAIKGSCAGLRWLAVDGHRQLSAVTRSHVIGEKLSKRGLLFTIYGGKLTTYRTLAQSLGDRITNHFGEFRPCGTAEAVNWADKDDTPRGREAILERFTTLFSPPPSFTPSSGK